MRGVEDAAPYGRCLKYCDNIVVNTDENGICNALPTKIYRGNVGAGVPDDPFLTLTPRYLYYTNLPVKFQFEKHPIRETAVNESLQITFFKKAGIAHGCNPSNLIYRQIHSDYSACHRAYNTAQKLCDKLTVIGIAGNH